MTCEEIRNRREPLEPLEPVEPVEPVGTVGTCWVDTLDTGDFHAPEMFIVNMQCICWANGMLRNWHPNIPSESKSIIELVLSRMEFPQDHFQVFGSWFPEELPITILPIDHVSIFFYSALQFLSNLKWCQSKREMTGYRVQPWTVTHQRTLSLLESRPCSHLHIINTTADSCHPLSSAFSMKIAVRSLALNSLAFAELGPCPAPHPPTIAFNGSILGFAAGSKAAAVGAFHLDNSFRMAPAICRWPRNKDWSLKWSSKQQSCTISSVVGARQLRKGKLYWQLLDNFWGSNVVCVTTHKQSNNVLHSTPSQSKSSRVR